MVIEKEIVDKNKKIDEQNCKKKRDFVFPILMTKRRNYAYSQASA